MSTTVSTRAARRLALRRSEVNWEIASQLKVWLLRDIIGLVSLTHHARTPDVMLIAIAPDDLPGVVEGKAKLLHLSLVAATRPDPPGPVHFGVEEGGARITEPVPPSMKRCQLTSKLIRLALDRE